MTSDSTPPAILDVQTTERRSSRLWSGVMAVAIFGAMIAAVFAGAAFADDTTPSPAATPSGAADVGLLEISRIVNGATIAGEIIQVTRTGAAATSTSETSTTTTNDTTTTTTSAAAPSPSVDAADAAFELPAGAAFAVITQPSPVVLALPAGNYTVKHLGTVNQNTSPSGGEQAITVIAGQRVSAALADANTTSTTTTTTH